MQEDKETETEEPKTNRSKETTNQSQCVDLIDSWFKQTNENNFLVIDKIIFKDMTFETTRSFSFMIFKKLLYSL